MENLLLNWGCVGRTTLFGLIYVILFLVDLWGPRWLTLFKFWRFLNLLFEAQSPLLARLLEGLARVTFLVRKLGYLCQVFAQ